MLPNQAEIDVASYKLAASVSDLDAFEMRLRRVTDGKPGELERFIAGTGPAPAPGALDRDELIVLATDALKDAETIRTKANEILGTAMTLYREADRPRYVDESRNVVAWHQTEAARAGDASNGKS